MVSGKPTGSRVKEGGEVVDGWMGWFWSNCRAGIHAGTYPYTVISSKHPGYDCKQGNDFVWCGVIGEGQLIIT